MDRILGSRVGHLSSHLGRLPAVWISSLLELAIVLEATALLLVVLTGGFELGWVSAHDPSKPTLLLLLLVPLRLVLGGPLEVAELSRLIRQRADPWVARLGEWLRVRPAVGDVLFAVMVSRVTSLAAAFLVNILFPPERRRPFEMPFASQKFAEIFAAWDSGWYFDIARRGYYFNADGQSSVAFFPLYPLLMRILAWPFGGSDRALWLAGIGISYATFVAALFVLHDLAERITGSRESARRAVLYIAVFPFSFFFARVYTESLFLLVSLLAVSAAWRSHWWIAGACGALAALTRPNGVLIAVPLFCLALAGRPGLSTLVKRGMALSGIPLALVGYSLYVYGLAGDPLAWMAAQKHWQYRLWQPPWNHLLSLASQIEQHGPYDVFFVSKYAPYQIVHGTIAFLVLLITPFVFTRLGLALGAYTLAAVLVPLSSSDMQGIGRYTAVLFPLFIVLGTLRSDRLHEALLVVWALFLAVFAGLFVTLHPIF
ncbi:MAG: hypothetical protein HYZ58_00190 [Acidobacteria bacterium]|nr:hypothetical protein [Acidobacteriota bacterium]